MNTRYSRPFDRSHGAYAGLWFALPLLLVVISFGLLALLHTPEAPPSRAQTTTELPSLPPAA
jgi:hypothetical protein